MMWVVVQVLGYIRICTLSYLEGVELAQMADEFVHVGHLIMHAELDYVVYKVFRVVEELGN